MCTDSGRLVGHSEKGAQRALEEGRPCHAPIPVAKSPSHSQPIRGAKVSYRGMPFSVRAESVAALHRSGSSGLGKSKTSHPPVDGEGEPVFMFRDVRREGA